MGDHKQAKALSSSKGKVSMAQFQSGPIPSADELKKLNDVIPGVADRIVAMAEFEQKSRIEASKRAMDIQDKISTMEIRSFNIGKVLGVVSVLLVILLCCYIAYLGGLEVAGKVATTVIVALASVFALKFFTSKFKANDENK